MELQFQKEAYDCLRRAVWETKNEEQTQEIKLPDSMPDVGKVLGAWGQVVMRGKEWRGNGMGISGGVMVWVLYAPEDGTEPRSVEGWIPFQMRWDFPQTQRDGAIVARCLLQGVDARAVSARKLMVRAVISAVGEALEPIRAEIFFPGEIPEDVCLLKKSYPVCLPREAGEKTFSLEEQLQLPGSLENVQRLLCYTMHCELTDKKVMADKVVFRGSGLLHGLCRCTDGTLHAFDFELPFSQYTELETEYGPDALPVISPAVTNLELELDENGSLQLKAGLVGQYVIYDQPLLEIIEDAYSPIRPVTLQQEQLQLPAVLERRQDTLQFSQPIEADAAGVLDVVVTMEHPIQRRREEQLQMELPGSFQMLYYDEDGNLQSKNAKWLQQWELPAGAQTTVLASAQPTGSPQWTQDAQCIQPRTDILVDTVCEARTGIPMVTALELGEQTAHDSTRPSLILRRMGTASLWDVAKQCGSTVEAILQANGLTDQPEPGEMLMIPVM